MTEPCEGCRDLLRAMDLGALRQGVRDLERRAATAEAIAGNAIKRDEHDKLELRVRSLEGARWQIVGIVTFVVFLATFASGFWQTSGRDAKLEGLQNEMLRLETAIQKHLDETVNR